MSDDLRKAAQDVIDTWWMNHEEWNMDNKIAALTISLTNPVAAPTSHPEIPDNSQPVARVTGYYGGRCVIEPLDRKSIFPFGMAMYVSGGSADAIDWEGVAADQAMTIAMMQVDAEQDKKDAARYRWMRSHPNGVNFYNHRDPQVVEDLIDAAIAEPEQEPDCKMGKMCIGCTPQPEECKPAPQSAQTIECERCGLTSDQHTASHWCDNQSFQVTAPPSREWQSVTDAMPKSGVTVLVCYRNSLGNIRRIRAKWTAAKTEETTAEFDWGECDEETDTYWIPEGWYECIDNRDEFSSIAAGEGEITHWMPLPLAPDDPNYTAPPSREWQSLSLTEMHDIRYRNGHNIAGILLDADAALRAKNSGEQA